MDVGVSVVYSQHVAVGGGAAGQPARGAAARGRARGPRGGRHAAARGGRTMGSDARSRGERALARSHKGDEAVKCASRVWPTHVAR